MDDSTTFPEVGDHQYSEDNVNNMQHDTFEQQEQTLEQDMGVAEEPSEPALPDGWRPGDWKCSKCNDHNFASRVVCRACGVPKDGAKPQDKPDNWRPGDWQCSRCGDHQFASRMYCRQCDAPKNARGSNPPPEKSGDPKKLYVGNLNPSTLEDSLKDAMSRFGPVTDCYILGPKGNSKGFAFVEFVNVEDAKSALGTSFELDGNALKIEKSMSRRDDLGGAWAPPEPVPANKLYVGKVSPETSHEQFKEYLSQFGEIKDSVVMGERGFGFVTFKDSSSAQAALSAKLELNGRELSIQRAKPKRNDDYGGGYGGGGYGGRGYGYPPPDRYGYRGRDDYYGGRGYDDYYGRGGGGGGYGGYDDYYGGRGGWGGGGGHGPPPYRSNSRGWSPPRNRGHYRGRW